MVWGGFGRVSPLVGRRAVGGDALVLDVGDVAVLVVGVVGHDLENKNNFNIFYYVWELVCVRYLCASVGEGDAVLSGDGAILILGLLLVEAGAGVLVLHPVGVGEGARGDLVSSSVVRGGVRGRVAVAGGGGAGGEGGGRGGQGQDDGEELEKEKISFGAMGTYLFMAPLAFPPSPLLYLVDSFS